VAFRVTLGDQLTWHGECCVTPKSWRHRAGHDAVHAPGQDDMPMVLRRSIIFKRFTVAFAAAALLLAAPRDAHASLLSPEMEDKVANVIAIFVLFVVPVVLIVLFWMVHVLP